MDRYTELLQTSGPDECLECLRRFRYNKYRGILYIGMELEKFFSWGKCLRKFKTKFGVYPGLDIDEIEDMFSFGIIGHKQHNRFYVQSVEELAEGLKPFDTEPTNMGKAYSEIILRVEEFAKSRGVKQRNPIPFSSDSDIMVTPSLIGDINILELVPPSQDYRHVGAKYRIALVGISEEEAELFVANIAKEHGLESFGYVATAPKGVEAYYFGLKELGEKADVEPSVG